MCSTLKDQLLRSSERSLRAENDAYPSDAKWFLLEGSKALERVRVDSASRLYRVRDSAQ
jgi:hypothetical protein